MDLQERMAQERQDRGPAPEQRNPFGSTDGPSYTPDPRQAAMWPPPTAQSPSPQPVPPVVHAPPWATPAAASLTPSAVVSPMQPMQPMQAGPAVLNAPTPLAMPGMVSNVMTPPAPPQSLAVPPLGAPPVVTSPPVALGRPAPRRALLLVLLLGLLLVIVAAVPLLQGLLS